MCVCLYQVERALFDAGQHSRRCYDKWKLERRGPKLETSKYISRKKHRAGSSQG